MFEYIFNQITNEIRHQLQSTTGPESKETVLNGWRTRLKERMRQLEKELKLNKDKYASDDFDQSEDSHKDSHDKFSFCHFLLEDFIDEQIADATGKSISAVISGTSSRPGPPGSNNSAGGILADAPAEPKPFRWSGSRREIVNLVKFLSEVANGPASMPPAPEDILAVSSMFVDDKGKPFPDTLFVPKARPVPDAANVVKPASAARHAKQNKTRKPVKSAGKKRQPKPMTASPKKSVPQKLLKSKKTTKKTTVTVKAKGRKVKKSPQPARKKSK